MKNLTTAHVIAMAIKAIEKKEAFEKEMSDLEVIKTKLYSKSEPKAETSKDIIARLMAENEALREELLLSQQEATHWYNMYTDACDEIREFSEKFRK